MTPLRKMSPTHQTKAEHRMNKSAHSDLGTSESDDSLMPGAAIAPTFLSSGCRCVLANIAMLMCALVLHAATSTLPVGTRVEFDKVYADNPALSQWVGGEITGYMAQQNYYKIRSTNGINYTIANDPRWIRIAGATGLAATPGQRAEKVPPAETKSTRPATPPKQPGPAGGYAPGTLVEFDRVEATTPEHGRWDSGTIIGRDAFNRYQIRGTNGILYNIHNDSH